MLEKMPLQVQKAYLIFFLIAEWTNKILDFIKENRLAYFFIIQTLLLSIFKDFLTYAMAISLSLQGLFAYLTPEPSKLSH